ncbi:hypothetical protein GALL_354490 [mine drainage metagenome]|uniref:DUF2798 domain-containing protein n=1 Tax=mine drainage metagenome TaxID=410659 RepID=A0A1J5R3N0_9ZZZZ
MTRKVSYRYRGILFALIMSSSTALIASGIIIYLHGSTHAAFIKAWLTAFVTAWPIVFIAILGIAPQVNRLLNLFVEDNKNGSSLRTSA